VCACVCVCLRNSVREFLSVSLRVLRPLLVHARALSSSLSLHTHTLSLPPLLRALAVRVLCLCDRWRDNERKRVSVCGRGS